MKNSKHLICRDNKRHCSREKKNRCTNESAADEAEFGVVNTFDIRPLRQRVLKYRFADEKTQLCSVSRDLKIHF